SRRWSRSNPSRGGGWRHKGPGVGRGTCHGKRERKRQAFGCRIRGMVERIREGRKSFFAQGDLASWLEWKLQHPGQRFSRPNATPGKELGQQVSWNNVGTADLCNPGNGSANASACSQKEFIEFRSRPQRCVVHRREGKRCPTA